MAKVVRELWEGKWVRIGVARNDVVDIKCGGPAVLGFDFVVAWEEDNQNLTALLKQEMKTRPYISLQISDRKIEVPKLWSRDEISECIETEWKNGWFS